MAEERSWSNQNEAGKNTPAMCLRVLSAMIHSLTPQLGEVAGCQPIM
jgi:hypothetical protein